MGLATEILRFFYIDIDDKSSFSIPKTIEEFTRQPEYFETINILEVFKVISKLKVEGYLVSAGHFLHVTDNPLTNEALVSFNFKEDVAKYGTYDFIINGFSSIANHFNKSVRPVIITKQDNSYDIGTGFLLGNFHTFVTARHVVENAALIQIPDMAGNYIKAQEIVFPEDEKIDIAIVLVSESAFSGTPPFNAKDAEILEDIMTIGYPPIPGFDAVQIYETASINNSFKFSKGQIIGRDTAYLDGIEYLIMNAKVKGGNSGSPVINKKGNLVGMVVQIPMDINDTSKLDSLGYGIITPKAEIIRLLVGSDNVPRIKKYKVSNLDNGFKIIV